MIELVKFFVNEKEISTNLNNSKSLLEVLIENNITIKANCEGNGVCGKCHINIDYEHFNKLNINDDELDTLEKQINATGLSRLACQIKICKELDGAKIKIIKEVE